MADFLPANILEWQACINAAWPEIVLPATSSTSNFFTAVQALKQNILQRFQNSDAGGTPALPYALLAIGNCPAMTMTTDRNDKNETVTIFYIDSEANGATQITVSAKLAALDQYIRTRNNQTFCILADANIDSSDMNPVNSVLNTISGVHVYGGTITYPKVYTVNLT